MFKRYQWINKNIKKVQLSKYFITIANNKKFFKSIYKIKKKNKKT